MNRSEHQTKIPKCLAHLDTFAGMPVPYVVEYVDGKRARIRLRSQRRSASAQRACTTTWRDRPASPINQF
jgi:hypothetical protein